MRPTPPEMLPYDFEKDPFTAPYRALRDDPAVASMRDVMTTGAGALGQIDQFKKNMVTQGIGAVGRGIDTAAQAVNRGVLEPMQRGVEMDFPKTQWPPPNPNAPKNTQAKLAENVLPNKIPQQPKINDPLIGHAPRDLPGNMMPSQPADKSTLYGGRGGTPDIDIESLRIPQEKQTGSKKALADLQAMYSQALQSLSNPNLSPEARKGIGDLLGIQKGAVEAAFLQEGKGQGQNNAPYSIESVAPGQSMFRMNKATGQVEPMGQAPEKPGVAQERDQKAHDVKVDNATRLWLPFKKQYDEQWDNISQQIPAGPEREKALYALNKQHFTQQGIPEDLAGVPESFTMFLEMMAPNNEQITAEQKKQYASVHKQAIKQRNQMLKKFWNDALQFSSY